MKLVIGIKGESEATQIGYTLLQSYLLTNKLVSSNERSHLITNGDHIFLSLDETKADLVKNICIKYGIVPNDIMVIHDEKSLPVGKSKVKIGGGSGGHQYIKYLINELPNQGFLRLKLGTGLNKNNFDIAETVVLETSFKDFYSDIDKFLNTWTSEDMDNG